MTYAATLQSITRTPVTYCVITLDTCALSFGVAPCTGAGEPCYNTIKTCKSLTNFTRATKDFTFSSADAAIPFPGPRPYIKSVKYLATEIKDNFTVNGRVTLECYDEPDTDIGIDPYVDLRSNIEGTFWKKLIARNPNYKGRPISIREGFLGEPVVIDYLRSEDTFAVLTDEDTYLPMVSSAAPPANPCTEFIEKWRGKLDTIKISGGTVKIEAVDLLKSLADITVPPKLDVKLEAEVLAAATQLTLNSVTGLDAAGYIRVNDEIIQYAALDTTSKILTGLTRAQFSTVAADHAVRDKVQKCRYFPPANPFDILTEFLQTDCGVPTTDINLTDFTFWRDWPGGEVNFSAILVEPNAADKLYFALVNILDCKSWVAEDLKITIRRNIPNHPGQTYLELTDADNIINGSPSVDLNDASRITRSFLYWDKNVIDTNAGAGSSAWKRIDVAVDADAESAAEYGDVVEDKLECEWLRLGYMQNEPILTFVTNFLARRVWLRRDAMPVLTLNVELKDSGLITGQYVHINTDELCNPDGTPLYGRFQITKRDPKDNGQIALTALRIPNSKVCFIAPVGAPDFDDATPADKEYGYITDINGQINNSDGYHLW